MSTWVVMPSDDDVIHGHKYIDKIMGKNGKWRYIYYRAKTKAKNAIGVGQKGRLERAKANVVTAEAHRNAFGNFTGNGKPIYLDKVIETKREEKKAQEAYDKTLLGKIDQVKDSGLKAWDSFISLFKKEENPSRRVTNWSKGEQYTPSYSTKPTTATRGTAYSPSGKTTVTNNSSKGTSYTPSYTSKTKKSNTMNAVNKMTNKYNGLSNSNNTLQNGLARKLKSQSNGVSAASNATSFIKKKKKKKA